MRILYSNFFNLWIFYVKTLSFYNLLQNFLAKQFFSYSFLLWKIAHFKFFSETLNFFISF